MAKKQLQEDNESSSASETAMTVGLPKQLRQGRNFAAVREIIETNLGANSGLSFSDLNKVSMPAGGGTVWQVPTPDGDKNEETITGVVVAFQDAKSYWSKSLDETGGGEPPDCRSTDLIHGIGTPGILCGECPNNVFGSALKGDGKACKDLRILYILSGESLLPKVIVVPPTSLKAVRAAFLSLATDFEVPYYGAVLSFSLIQDKNKAGIKYSKIVVKREALLEDEAFAKAQSYNEMLKPMLNGMFTAVIEGNATHEEQDDYIDTESTDVEDEAGESEAPME